MIILYCTSRLYVWLFPNTGYEIITSYYIYLFLYTKQGLQQFE